MRHVYLSLALNSLEKNRRLYVPYAGAGAMMFALYSIMAALLKDPYVNSIRGSRTLGTILSVGQPVILFLSVIFIFYISSFVMKRRKKELGMYSVLGMEKSHVIRVVTIENLFTGLAGMTIGTLLTIALEKGVQYILIKIMGASADKGLVFPGQALVKAWIFFGIIYLLVILNCAREILFFSAINYMKEESAGEKKPKFNPVIGILGIVMLICAYIVAGTGDSNYDMILRFAVAVLMVIAGTYMLFISGSVMILTLLKKNKKYYYRTSRFISVSGMIYRMKRHGAGLASICILSTMVLVMMSSVTTVYLCSRETADNAFPRDYRIRIEPHFMEETDENDIHEDADNSPVMERFYDLADDMGVTISGLNEYGFLYTYTSPSGNDLILDGNKGIGTVFISVDDYNEVNGTDITLPPDKAGVIENETYLPDSFTVPGGMTYGKTVLTETPDIIVDESLGGYEILWIVLPDKVDIGRIYDDICHSEGHEGRNVFYSYTPNGFVQFNLSGTREQQETFFIRASEEIMGQTLTEEDLTYMNTCEGGVETSEGTYFAHIFCKCLFMDFFYAVYGGVFFLGILLSIVCIVIAVLVIYFKQLLEGYEDAQRFGIMKKVGLSDKEIKKSVYSQMVTVFFLPVLTAGVHTLFAFRMVNNLMRYTFGFQNGTMFFFVLIAVLFIFAVFYFVVFLITVRNYIKIVENSAS